MPGQLLAGYYPGAPEFIEAAGKLQALFDSWLHHEKFFR
jgi:hypothetical protein